MFVPFAEMKTAPFKSYDDIPPLTREYIVYVTEEKVIENIPLEDINTFMTMQYEIENDRLADFEDGLVQ